MESCSFKRGEACVKGQLSPPKLPPLEWGVAEWGEGSHLSQTLHRLSLCMADQCVHMPRYSQNRSLEDWMRARTPSPTKCRHSQVQDQMLLSLPGFSSPFAGNALTSILIVHTCRTATCHPLPQIDNHRIPESLTEGSTGRGNSSASLGKAAEQRWEAY